MTLAVAVAVPGGLVLAADSRSTYENPKKWPRIASDSTDKVFRVSQFVGACTFGWGTLNGRSIRSHMDQLSMEAGAARIHDLLPRFADYFQQAYDEHRVRSAKNRPRTESP